MGINDVYIPSPTQADYEEKNKELIEFGIKQGVPSLENGPNNFRYIEALLFSNKNTVFRNFDASVTDETYFDYVKDKEGVSYNVIKFDRKHNIRAFDFILSYHQINSWGSKVYKPVSITKQFKGSLIFTGCSNTYNKELREKIPFILHTQYELIGDSIGEDNALTDDGRTKGGPVIKLSYAYDEDFIYVYVDNFFPYRIIPSGPGQFQDISISENTGSFIHENKQKNIAEKDHLYGLVEETKYSQDPASYCDIYLSLKDVSIGNDDDAVVEKADISYLEEISDKEKYILISPPRNGAKNTVDITLSNDVNVEAANDIHPLNFGSRLLGEDKGGVERIAGLIEKRIKDSSLSVGKIPFIISESIRFRGSYNIIENKFVDSKADSFGRYLIKEIGCYDAFNDSFDITNYIFDLENNKGKFTVGDIRGLLKNALSGDEGDNSAPSTYKSDLPLSFIKSFEYALNKDLSKYNDVSFVEGRLNGVKNVFIELADSSVKNDFDKLIYFSYNNLNDNDKVTPIVTVCDFRDVNMEYCVQKEIFYNVQSHDFEITAIYRYEDDSSYKRSYTYLIGTNKGVFFTMYLDENFKPVIENEYHNPFIHNYRTFDNDNIIGDEPIFRILKTDKYIIFIGISKFSIFDIDNKSYIPVDQERYNNALKGKKLHDVSSINENQFIFTTEEGLFTYDITTGLWTTSLNNFKYNVLYEKNHPSINYNFDIDNIHGASIIQMGQYLYLINCLTQEGKIASRKLNTATGEILDISNKIDIVNPTIFKNKENIYCIGGKRKSEAESLSYIDNASAFFIYSTIHNKWFGRANFLLDIIDPLGSGDKGRLSLNGPSVVMSGNTAYIFHPTLVNQETGNKYYNNGIIEISDINDDAVVNQYQFDSPLEDSIFILPLYWVPLRWNNEWCEFVSVYRDNDSYIYKRFKVFYASRQVEIIDEYPIADDAFTYYSDDPASVDALKGAKIYRSLTEQIIFCRDKFIIHIGEAGTPPSIYTLWDDEQLYPGCRTLLSEEDFMKYWYKYSGNKTHENTYLAYIDEYLVFCGGENYKAPDYFDLNTFEFLENPRYGTIDETNYYASQILKASSELTKIPSSFLSVSSMSSYAVDGDIYIAASITTNSLILKGSINSMEERPILLLFKIDTLKDEYNIALVKDLTAAVTKRGNIDSFKFINIYQVGKYLFISSALRTFFLDSTYSHEIDPYWNNVIVYNTMNNDLIDFSTDEEVEGIGLFPLIFKYDEKTTIICVDKTSLNTYPLLNGARSDYIVGFQKEENDIVNRWKRNRNTLRLASEDELPFNYASGASYGKYGFIATQLTLEIVDLDLLIRSGAPGDNNRVDSRIIYRFSNLDKALFKDIFVDGDYLYVTGGMIISSTQGDASGGVNNRMLMFFIPDILNRLNGVRNRLHDISKDINYYPRILQLSSAAIKYFSSYGITKKQDIITVGDINFLNSSSPFYSSEKSPFDVIISFKGYSYSNVDRSFVKKSKLYTIEPLPLKSANRYNPSEHVFNINNREFILVYGGQKSPTSGFERSLSLYDVTLHKWIDLPPLPEVLENISFVENKIIGASKVNDDLTLEPFNKMIELMPLQFFNNWVWRITDFTTEDLSLPPNSVYARREYFTGHVKSLYVYRNPDRTLYSQGTMVQTQLWNSLSGDSTIETIPNIPAGLETFEVLGCDIHSDGGHEQYLVLLYHPSDKTFHLWSYKDGVWQTLFTNVGLGTLDGDINQILFSSSNQKGEINNKMGIACTCIKNGEVHFYTIEWDIMSDGSAGNIEIKTCGSLSTLDQRINAGDKILYSPSSGAIYIKDETGTRYCVDKKNLLFYEYNASKNDLKNIENEIVSTTFTEKLSPYKHNNMVYPEALQVEQLHVNINDFNGVATVFTMKVLGEDKQQFFISYYNFKDNSISPIRELYISRGEQYEFLINDLGDKFDIIPLPFIKLDDEGLIVEDAAWIGPNSTFGDDVFGTRLFGSGISRRRQSFGVFALITHINDELKIIGVVINGEDGYINSVEMSSLKDEEGSPCCKNAGFKHCFDQETNTLYQLASYNTPYLQINYGNVNLEDLYLGNVDHLSLSKTNNLFDNSANIKNIDLQIVCGKYLALLLSQKNASANQHTNRLYTARLKDIGGVDNCFEQYEIPLSCGKYSLTNAFDKKGTLYLVPDRNNRTPIIECSIDNDKDVFLYRNSQYIEMNMAYNDVSTYENISANWLYMDSYLYNFVYGVRMPLYTVVEQKLPYSFMISTKNKEYALFSTFKDSIYVVNCIKDRVSSRCFLDIIDDDTLTRTQHIPLHPGDGMSKRRVHLPFKGAIASINISGDIILVAGGFINDELNKKVFAIDVKSGKVNLLYNDCDIGTNPSYYESLDEDIVYIFPKSESKIIILPYSGEGDPIVIPYLESVSILKVLFRLNRNKLKVIGSFKGAPDKIIFDVDLFTGEINNLIYCNIKSTIVCTINNRSHALIYAKKDDKHVSVYKYESGSNELTLIADSFPSVTADKNFKVDGLYERDDFIGMNVNNDDNGSLENLYRFKSIRPDKKSIGSPEIPIILPNSIALKDSKYNSPLSTISLKDTYDIYKVDDTYIRFNKSMSRIEIIGEDIIYIPCSNVLWLVKFYDDILISVLDNNSTIVYDVDVLNNKICGNSDATGNELLNQRRTSEAAFLSSNITEAGKEIGMVYLAGGESDNCIFQDVLSLYIVKEETSPGVYTLSIDSESIIPNGEGVYKSKMIKLSNSEIAVVFGLSFTEEHGGAAINKPVNQTAAKNNLNASYFRYGVDQYTTETPVSAGDPNRFITPGGETNQAFILSGHVFINAAGHIFAGEIKNSRITDLVQFKDYIDHLPVPISDVFVNRDVNFKNEINKNTVSPISYLQNNPFNNLFSYHFDKSYIQSRFEEFKNYIIESHNDTIEINKIPPRKMDIIKVYHPSKTLSYEFDIIFMKEYYTKDKQKIIVFDRVPCTPYRMDISKKDTYVKIGSPCCKEIGFTYDVNSNELVEDDSSLLNGNWEVLIVNGEESERRIKIVFNRYDRSEGIFEISGDDPDFPFKFDMIPVLLTYGENEQDALLGYRYCVFVDVKGNVATFDRDTNTFVHPSGSEDVDVPYFSGELTIFPSKTTEQGSVGRRVWGYSNENPYIDQPDKISLEDPTLIS
jgi:hypothetical protein